MRFDNERKEYLQNGNAFWMMFVSMIPCQFFERDRIGAIFLFYVFVWLFYVCIKSIQAIYSRLKDVHSWYALEWNLVVVVWLVSIVWFSVVSWGNMSYFGNDWSGNGGYFVHKWFTVNNCVLNWEKSDEKIID